MKAEREYVVGLDLVRFAAAIAVMLHHLTYMIWAHPEHSLFILPKGINYVEISGFTWFGWVGVEIFFVISGFVIAASAEASNSYRFVRGRMLRLYPAAWICIPLSFLAATTLGHTPILVAIKRAAGSAFLSPVGPWIDGVYWTLGVEVIFYFAIFVLLRVGARRHLFSFGIALGVWSGAYIALCVILAPSLWHLDGVWERVTLLRDGSNFALGIMLWRYHNRPSVTTWAVALFFLVVGTAEVWLSSVMAVLAAPTGAGLGRDSIYSAVALWLAFLAVAVALLKFNQRLLTLSPTVRGLFRLFGLATYPIYLIHNLVGASIIAIGLKCGLSKWLSLTSALIFICAIGIVFAKFVEPAFRRRLAAFL